MALFLVHGILCGQYREHQSVYAEPFGKVFEGTEFTGDVFLPTVTQSLCNFFSDQTLGGIRESFRVILIFVSQAGVVFSGDPHVMCFDLAEVHAFFLPSLESRPVPSSIPPPSGLLVMTVVLAGYWLRATFTWLITKVRSILSTPVMTSPLVMTPGGVVTLSH